MGYEQRPRIDVVTIRYRPFRPATTLSNVLRMLEKYGLHYQRIHCAFCRGRRISSFGSRHDYYPHSGALGKFWRTLLAMASRAALDSVFPGRSRHQRPLIMNSILRKWICHFSGIHVGRRSLASVGAGVSPRTALARSGAHSRPAGRSYLGIRQAAADAPAPRARRARPSRRPKA